MNSEMGPLSSKLRGPTAPVKCLREDPRGTRHRARNIAPHTCIRWIHADRTMMQSCASAAKLRAAGPFSPSASGATSATGSRHLGSSIGSPR